LSPQTEVAGNTKRHDLHLSAYVSTDRLTVSAVYFHNHTRLLFIPFFFFFFFFFVFFFFFFFIIIITTTTIIIIIIIIT
jgi:hypothetical protein